MMAGEKLLRQEGAIWRDYLQLCKPKVVLVMLVTAVVGMLLAARTGLPWQALVYGSAGIGLAASGAAAINHIIDRHLDAHMSRTCRRPLPQGRITTAQASLFAALTGSAGIALLATQVNALTAWLTLASLLGYAFVYTAFLKRTTPQNIVIGGIAGAAPPLLGWSAVTGSLDVQGIVLMMIIFAWTPPHFWPLCLHKKADYAATGIPMLPVTHGEAFTRLQVLLYSILLCIVTLWPYLIGMSGMIYLALVALLNARFMQWALRLLYRFEGAEMGLFLYSIKYILLLFAALLLDHYASLLGAYG